MGENCTYMLDNTKSEKENLYLLCEKWDIVGKLEQFFSGGNITLRDDYRITIKAPAPTKNTPWIYTRHSDRNCFLYHHIMFPVWKMIHTRCQDCWKVVVAPRTVVELMKLYYLQTELQASSKCGTEGDRPNSDKLYGGYFYNNSLEEGERCYQYVRAVVSERISPDVPVILKRACTEFEQELGPSTEWKVTEEQKELEYILDEVTMLDLIHHQQSHHMRMHLLKKWIHKAYQWGDKSYLELTGGSPLFRQLVTYHQNIKPQTEGTENGKSSS